MTERMKRQTWHDRLEPYAIEFADSYRQFEARIRSESDADLAKLITATTRPTQSNCWWATYEVASSVRRLAAAEQLRRKRAAS